MEEKMWWISGCRILEKRFGNKGPWLRRSDLAVELRDLKIIAISIAFREF